MVKNLLALLYVALSWGTAFALIKYAEETISPLTVQAGRCTIGFIALLILAIVLKRDIKGHAKYWFAWLVFAVLGSLHDWAPYSIIS